MKCVWLAIALGLSEKVNDFQIKSQWLSVWFSMTLILILNDFQFDSQWLSFWFPLEMRLNSIGKLSVFGLDVTAKRLRWKVKRAWMGQRRAGFSTRCAPKRGNVLWRFILEPLVSLLKIALLIVRTALHKCARWDIFIFFLLETLLYCGHAMGEP